MSLCDLILHTLVTFSSGMLTVVCAKHEHVGGEGGCIEYLVIERKKVTQGGTRTNDQANGPSCSNQDTESLSKLAELPGIQQQRIPS